MRVFILVCKYVCMRGCVCACVCAHRCIFFPLVQCTYIGPTVHIHDFLLSFKQRARSFLHTALIQTDQACSVFHLRCFTGDHTHLFNLLILWNGQPAVIIDQTHLSIYLSVIDTAPNKKRQKGKKKKACGEASPNLFHPSGHLPLETTKKD